MNNIYIIILMLAVYIVGFVFFTLLTGLGFGAYVVSTIIAAVLYFKE